MCSRKHGLLPRWKMGKVMFPSVRLVVVPHDDGKHADIVYLSNQALSVCVHKPPDISWFLVLIDRSPSIKESHVRVFRVALCLELVKCKMHHSTMGPMDGDCEGDTMTVWLLSPTYLHGSLGSVPLSSLPPDEPSAVAVSNHQGCFTAHDLVSMLHSVTVV